MVIFQSLDKKIPSSHEISLDHGSKAVRRSLVILCKALLIYGVNQMVVTIKKRMLMAFLSKHEKHHGQCNAYVTKRHSFSVELV